MISLIYVCEDNLEELKSLNIVRYIAIPIKNRRNCYIIE